MREKRLLSRQKLLLALLQVFGRRLPGIELQKYLFLFTEKYQTGNKSYEFVPYSYGCFSFQSYADRRRLTEVGVIAKGDDWQLTGKGNYLEQVSPENRDKLHSFHHTYKHLRGDELVRHIYRNYPYYAINSEIAADIMSQDELDTITAARPAKTRRAFFTIGYEGQSFENYLNRLLKNNIRLLCDVRKNPLSRKYGFAKSTLSETLKKLDIEYSHIPELGIVSSTRQKLKTQADYESLFKDYEASTLKQNVEALDKLEKLFMKHKRIAITCFEASHTMCHRSRVAKAMRARPGWKYPIVHI